MHAKGCMFDGVYVPNSQFKICTICSKKFIPAYKHLYVSKEPLTHKKTWQCSYKCWLTADIKNG